MKNREMEGSETPMVFDESLSCELYILTPFTYVVFLAVIHGDERIPAPGPQLDG